MISIPYDPAYAVQQHLFQRGSLTTRPGKDIVRMAADSGPTS